MAVSPIVPRQVLYLMPAVRAFAASSPACAAAPRYASRQVQP
jgi:hypothetical protein